MKIYLAARYSRRVEMQGVATELAKRGHYITSRWVSGSHDLTSEEREAYVNGIFLPEVVKKFWTYAIEDRDDVRVSDCLIGFTEAPRTTRSNGGRHVELGMAIALRKRIIIVGPQENVFHCLYCVKQYDTLEQMLEEL